MAPVIVSIPQVAVHLFQDTWGHALAAFAGIVHCCHQLLCLSSAIRCPVGSSMFLLLQHVWRLMPCLLHHCLSRAMLCLRAISKPPSNGQVMQLINLCKCAALKWVVLQAMRLFVGEPVWTPLNRPIDDHDSRKKYVATFQATKAFHETPGSISSASPIAAH